MRTSFFSASPSTETLRKDVRVLAEDTMKVARQRVVDPAVEAVQRAGIHAREVMHDAQHRIARQISDAERYASRQYDITERWVSANPFKAVGAALVIGLVLSSFFSSSKR